MKELGQEERSKLFERYGRSFEAGETVFSAGDVADDCFLIEEGRVRLIRRIRSAERNLTVLKPGDLFGEDALLPNARRKTSAEALTEVTALALDRATFGKLLASNEVVAVRLLGQVVTRLQDAEEQLEIAMLADAPSRVIHALLRRAADHDPNAKEVKLEMSPLELASRVGLDVDVVKESVQQLRDGGYLRFVGEQIVLSNLDALRKLYDLLGRKEEIKGV